MGWFENMKKRRQERLIEHLTRRAEEIFTIKEYVDGRMWLFCNNTGIFPCSHLNLKTEEEMLKFLNNLRELYVETESMYG